MQPNLGDNWRKHIGKIIATPAAFVFCILLFTIGPGKTILVAIGTCVGYLIGRFLDEARG